MNAKVLVLISTYNGEKYIEEQLDSLLMQTYKEIDILIRDDGSTDRTINLIEGYIDKNKEKITLIKGKNIGVVNSFFNLIDYAKNEYFYFAFCDQDDYWEKNKIEEAVKKLNESDNKLPLMYCSNKKIVDSNLKLIRPFEKKIIIPNFGNAMVENVATGCTILINSKLLDILKKERNTSKVIMHDWWIYLIATAFGRVIFDNNSYILYRQHENNVVGNSNWGKRIRNHIILRNENKLREQLIEFKKVYELLLTKENKMKLDNFLLIRSVLGKTNLIVKKECYRQNFIDNMIFSILYIMGRI